MSASRSEPEQFSQHDSVLDELEAALTELTAAEEQVTPEGEQLQLAVEAPDRKAESESLNDDTLHHDRWLKVAMPMAEVLEAKGVELRWQGMKALARAVCREHIPRSAAVFTPQRGWQSITERAGAMIEMAATGSLDHTANLGKRRKAKARRIRCKQRTSTARLLRQARQLLSRLGWTRSDQQGSDSRGYR